MQLVKPLARQDKVAATCPHSWPKLLVLDEPTVGLDAQMIDGDVHSSNAKGDNAERMYLPGPPPVYRFQITGGLLKRSKTRLL